MKEKYQTYDISGVMPVTYLEKCLGCGSLGITLATTFGAVAYIASDVNAPLAVGAAGVAVSGGWLSFRNAVRAYRSHVAEGNEYTPTP